MLSGILLLYHHPISANAPTILEHVHMFGQHSRFDVCEVNTEFGFPPELSACRFRVILLHYSLFGGFPYRLDDVWKNYLRQCPDSYKIAFFQDEYYRCPDRFEFIRQQNIDCIYSLLRPHLASQVYGRHTPIKQLRHTIPSYTSHELVELGERLAKPGASRPIDIGYRARPTFFHMGRGAREKTEIAQRFKEASQPLGLKLDIETAEDRRIYGDAWPKFLAACKAVLGVEAGVSIFDVHDDARLACEQWMREHPTATFEQVHEAVLRRWEDRLYYRTIGPRHFEAAAMRTCQILFEGEYSGILKPMVHYIPLKKDFANFDEVVRLFRDERMRRNLTEAAHHELIASGKYACDQFVAEFDRDLAEQGILPGPATAAMANVSSLLQTAARRRLRRRRLWHAMSTTRGRLGRSPWVQRAKMVAAAPMWVVGYTLGRAVRPLRHGIQRRILARIARPFVMGFRRAAQGT